MATTQTTQNNGRNSAPTIDPTVQAAIAAMRADFEAKIAALAAENAALKAGERQISMKVSDKGAVSVYGLGRFPTTLYAPQWLRLIENVGKVKDFIDANKDSLSWEKNHDKK